MPLLDDQEREIRVRAEEIVGSVPRRALVLGVFLAIAFAAALVVVLSLPSFWRGQPWPAFAGLGVLVVASGGALAAATKKR